MKLISRRKAMMGLGLGAGLFGGAFASAKAEPKDGITFVMIPAIAKAKRLKLYDVRHHYKWVTVVPANATYAVYNPSLEWNSATGDREKKVRDNSVPPDLVLALLPQAHDRLMCEIIMRDKTLGKWPYLDGMKIEISHAGLCNFINLVGEHAVFIKDGGEAVVL